MYKAVLYKELSQRLAERVEITTDTSWIEGLIVRMTPDFVVLDLSDEFNVVKDQYTFIKAINTVRFP